MKAFIAVIITFACIAASGAANVPPARRTSEEIICTAVCRPIKPECPAGQSASGSDGCWGCCQ
ncbi:hypothetical protein BYT27DRAFT_7191203 [Phlegmacium glaucopus]|nr:hypothetical protein BYT27DRAFT_7191203 [Phlegmacium glaucopus]